MEAAYLPEEQVIYHNSLHAADVLHSVHCLLDLPIIMDAFSDLEVGCCCCQCARGNRFLAAHQPTCLQFTIRSSSSCSCSRQSLPQQFMT